MEMSRIRTLLQKHTVEDLCTIVYTVVEDYIKLSLKIGRFNLPSAHNQKASYAEITSIALVGELLREAHSEHWFVHVKLVYAHLFKALPHVTRYHRVLKNLERVMADFALCLANTNDDSTTYVIDSKPLPICRYKRRAHPRVETQAASGYATMGFTHGFKLHAVMNNALMFARFAIVPANDADARVCQALLDGDEDDLTRVLGDRAYLGCGITSPRRSSRRR